MPQCNFHALHPDAPEPEGAYAHLAMAVLIGLISDLEGDKPKRRQEARAAVAAGVPDLWLGLLALNEEQTARVQALLSQLAH
jgi:hypothetical protein